MKVFIADDSAVVRERLVNMLSEYKEIEVIGEAQNTGEAIESIRRLHPDVVILDIRMPGGGGIDVLHEVKKDQPDVKVIMLTNYPYSQYRKKCIDEGADYFFDKSSEFENVTRVLRDTAPSFAESSR